MKKVKTDWRSSLHTDTLTGLMRILLHSPSEREFDPLPAISVWTAASRWKRRPFQAPYKPKIRHVEDDLDDRIDSEDCTDDDEIFSIDSD